jgi:hypothetical protein
VVGEVAEGGVQLLHLFGVGTLLRTENRRGTVGTAQGIVHVGGDFKAHLGQTRVEVVEADLCQSGQGQATGRQGLVRSIEQLHAQGLHGTCASIVGGAAADGIMRSAPRPGLRGSVHRYQRWCWNKHRAALRDQLQAAGLGHFDKGGVTVGQPPQRASTAPPNGPHTV